VQRSRLDSHGGAEIIAIDPLLAKDEINLSEFVDSVKYIKLQTDSNCITGRIHSITITNKYIYVCDAGQMAVLLFDMKGNFVSKLDKHGVGPDEYRYMSGFFVDDKEEYVEIATMDDQFLKYSNETFRFIEKQQIGTIKSSSSKKINSYYYFDTQKTLNQIGNETTNANIIIVKDGKVVKTLFHDKIQNPSNSSGSFGVTMTVNNNKELYFSMMSNNTIYQLKDLEIHPLFYIDFGNYGLDTTITSQKSFAELQKIIQNQADEKAYFPTLAVNNSKILGINYFFNKHNETPVSHYYIRTKQNNVTYHTSRIKNDITLIPQYINLSANSGGMSHEIRSSGDYLVQVVNPHELFFNNNLDYIMTAEVGKIKITDNPIIVLMKLRTY
jgi:hypothetical protein